MPECFECGRRVHFGVRTYRLVAKCVWSSYLNFGGDASASETDVICSSCFLKVRKHAGLKKKGAVHKPMSTPVSPTWNLESFSEMTEIGCGGFGIICSAVITTANLKCALKFIDLSSPSAENEKKLFAQLDHLNIIKYFGTFQTTDKCVIIMDLCDGGDLFKYMHGETNFAVCVER
jgi:hypothetical protein